MKNFKIFQFLFIFLFIFLPLFTNSQEKGLTLSITPPLIKINVLPGQTWSSFIKVINFNPHPLTVFASILDFKSGEEGGVVFFSPPQDEEAKNVYLSYWIELPTSPITILPFQSKEIPFIIRVPKEADPGGHYAAILVGTEPIGQEKPGTVVKISQQVSSLILLTVEGEILEKGFIREFSTERMFYQKPRVKFKLSFENLGNVHLQPVGEIKIYNIFGKERGKIPINQDTEFGNVLAKSKRVWNFEWEGEESLFEIGRFKAEIVLNFGQNNFLSDKKAIYFWIVPLVPTASILGGVILFILFLIISLRAYIKRAVKLAQMEILTQREFLPEKVEQIKISPSVIKKPVEEFILDLRGKKGRISFPVFLKKYSNFLLFLLLVFFWVSAFYFYFQDVLKPEKSFEILRKEGEKEIQISSEEIFKKEMEKETEKENNLANQYFSITVLNGSGIPKLAAKVAIFLENQGFKIEKVGNAESFNFEKTKIIFKLGKEKEMEILKEKLKKEVLIEGPKEQKEDIILIIGKDFKDFNL